MRPTCEYFDDRRLHIAAREGDVRRINYILEAGENVNKINADGDTPLHLAVWKQSKPAIRLLVLNGASTTKPDAGGMSPLEKAKQWGGEELGAFLKKMLEDYHILQSDLRKHMLTGDWNEFNKTLEYRCLINIYLPEEQTLLQVAAQSGSSKAIRELLDRGADIKAQDKDSRTALYVAAQSGSSEAIRELVHRGADIKAQDKDSRTALHVAAQSDSSEAIQELVFRGADIEAQDKDGQTALHVAAQSGSSKAIRELVYRGAGIKAQDKDGRTALHVAAQSDSSEAIQELVHRGADIEAQDKDGRMALHVAAQSGLSEAIRELLDRGADIEAQDKDGRTALHVAAQSGSSEDIEAQDKDGRTALHVATQSGSSEAIRELVYRGADIEAQDKDGRTALHVAAQSGSSKAIIQELVYRGADIKAQDKDSRTALHVAAQSDSSEAIQELVHRGADIEAQDKDGRTALHVAVQSGSCEAIRELLDHILAQDKDGRTAPDKAVSGHDESGKVNSADHDGKTPLHLAAKAGNMYAVELLLTKGAAESINLADNDGKTPGHLATEAGHESVVQLLVILGGEESLCSDDIVVEKPPGPTSDNRTLLTDVSVSGARSILRDSSMISNLRIFLVYTFQSIWSLFLSSELPQHVSRIRWTCHCGHQSYDDFISERKVVTTIADKMISSGIKAEVVTWRESGINTLLSVLKNLALTKYRRHAGTPPESNQSAPGNLQANLSAAAHILSRGVQDDTQDISKTELNIFGRLSSSRFKGVVKDEVRFVHLCIHMEFPLPCMAYIMIDPKSAPAKIINCDQQLFREIKEVYHKACKRRVTVFVKLAGIYFVQFQLFPRTLVDNLKKNKIPTDTSEYDFKKVGGLTDGDPPIPPGLMLHYYNKPECIMDGRLCLDAFPKRKIEPLYSGGDQPIIGYGIYLKEELNETLFALIRCSIPLCIGVIGWVVFLARHDLEKSYPWAAVSWISGIGVCALEVLKEWLKARFESGTVTKAKTE